MAGSVSGGCVENDVFERALRVLDEGRPALVEYGAADGLGFEVGLACGGSIDVLIEPFEPAEAWRVLRCVDSALDAALRGEAQRRMGLPGATVIDFPWRGETARIFIEVFPPPLRLYIVGATHTAIPLCRMAKELGFRVTVIDARSIFATEERFPEADELVHAWPDEAFERIELDAAAHVVTLTHDPKFDLRALARALRSEAGYVGALGSRVTHARRVEELRQQGFGEADLARIRTPIGLDIGSRTPEEVALSILAEMVALRRGRDGRPLALRSAPIHDDG
jgi:xanthine dehydrogenase accessory factor